MPTPLNTAKPLASPSRPLDHLPIQHQRLLRPAIPSVLLYPRLGLCSENMGFFSSVWIVSSVVKNLCSLCLSAAKTNVPNIIRPAVPSHPSGLTRTACPAGSLRLSVSLRSAPWSIQSGDSRSLASSVSVSVPSVV